MYWRRESNVKTVWILNHYAQEPGGPGGTRHYSLARHLLDSNWRSVVIAASTEHNTGRQRLLAHENTRLETFNGVLFLWVRTPEYKGNCIARIKNMLAYSWKSWLPATTRQLPRPDVVIGSSVHPFAAVAGLLLARRFRVPFVFEVRDLWPQTLIDMGKLSSAGIPARLMKSLEKWLNRNAARIIVLLPCAQNYLVPLGVEKNRIVYIPNGVEVGEIPIPANQRSAFTLMYFGAHGHANGLETLLLSMKILAQQGREGGLRLRMIGDGAQRRSLIVMANQLGLLNVSFEGAVSKSEIPNLAAQADAFIISVLDLPNLYRFGVSMNKLFDYLAANRPIILAGNIPQNPVAESNSGITVAPNNPEELANAIATLASLPISERTRMGAAGFEFVKANHSFALLAKRLALVLDDVSPATK